MGSAFSDEGSRSEIINSDYAKGSTSSEILIVRRDRD
jgi:hypothetical protein